MFCNGFHVFLQVFHTHVSSVSFSFKHIFQMLYLYVSKVDGGVAHVVMRPTYRSHLQQLLGRQRAIADDASGPHARSSGAGDIRVTRALRGRAKCRCEGGVQARVVNEARMGAECKHTRNEVEAQASGHARPSGHLYASPPVLLFRLRLRPHSTWHRATPNACALILWMLQ
jgi:hypothetical protein